MRRLVGVTTAALLSGAMVTAGSAAAQASSTATPTAAGFFTIPGVPFTTPSLIGDFALKRVDTASGVTRVGYLQCWATTKDRVEISGFGDMKDPTSACAELAAVNGDFDKLSVHPTWMSPAIVAPVDVWASGRWEKSTVRWTREYTNSGSLAKFTGSVFDL